MSPRDAATDGRFTIPRDRAVAATLGARFVAASLGFAEDLGILFRYAAGLDYYGRNKLQVRT